MAINAGGGTLGWARVSPSPDTCDFFLAGLLKYFRQALSGQKNVSSCQASGSASGKEFGFRATITGLNGRFAVLASSGEGRRHRARLRQMETLQTFSASVAISAKPGIDSVLLAW